MKIDYLTITLKPGSTGWNRDECFHRLLNILMIEEWQQSFKLLRSDKYYESVYGAADCYLKIPTEERLSKQGVCFEATGQGVESLNAYYESKGTDLRTAMNRFRSACRLGAVTRCSRIDIAIDEKCYGDDQPLLDLEIISDTLKKRAFVSRYRRSEPEVHSEELQSIFLVDPQKIDPKLPFSEILSQNISTGRIGRTIYLGKRTSGSYIRIYDKLAEQEVHGHTVEEGLTAWNRFEIEFHKQNAGAVFAAYCDCETDEQFGEFLAGVAYNLIRFVDMDRTRSYNATVCKWWLDFLGKFSEQKLIINKLPRNQYIRTRNYLNNNIAASLFAVVQCNPENLYTILAEGAKSVSNTKMQIINDYNILKNLPPDEAWVEVEESSRELTGLEYWRSFSIDPDFDKKLQEIYNRVFSIKTYDPNKNCL